MSQLTQAQVIAYNKKVVAAKEKASDDKARKELAEKELARTCDELSELLGKKITPENLESEYAAFVAEAQKTIESGTKILESIEQEQAAALDRGAAADDVSSASSVEETSAPEMPETTATQGKADTGLDLDSLLGFK